MYSPFSIFSRRLRSLTSNFRLYCSCTYSDGLWLRPATKLSIVSICPLLLAVLETLSGVFVAPEVAVVSKLRVGKVRTLFTCAEDSSTRRLEISCVNPSRLGDRRDSCGWPLLQCGRTAQSVHLFVNGMSL